MGQGRFIDEEVEVRVGDFGRPLSFVWRGNAFEVVEVLRSWRKLDLKRAWWRRRHRDHYLVRVSGGRVFELYFHRGPGRRFWVLLRELSPQKGTTGDRG
jgi:hypothetical protein